MTYGGTERTSPAPLYMPNMIAGLLAGLGVVIGSIGPWATFLAFTRGATDGDGMITMVLGVVALVGLFALVNLVRLGSLRGWMVLLAYLPSAAGFFAALTAGVNLSHIKSLETEIFDTTVSPEIGWGLWMVLICGVVLGITSFLVGTQLPRFGFHHDSLDR